MHYSAKYFRDNFPEWKHRKDFILTRIFHRPISFYVSAFCANHGIQANTVSIFSTFAGIIACSMFLFGRYECNIIGSVLISLWLILDCADGNLARSVRAQPFGEFVDAESSYILLGLLGSCVGISAYFTEGCGVFIHAGNAWLIFAGALASSCDTLVRLIYQKYQNMAAELAEKNIIPPHREKRREHEYSGSLRVKLENWPGMCGILPAIILLASVFNALDIVIIYMLLYYCTGAIVFITFYTVKAMHFRNIPMKQELL